MRRVLVAAWLLALSGVAGAVGVSVVLSTDERPYRDVGELVVNGLRRTGVDASQRALADLGVDDQLVIAVGTSAFRQVLSSPLRTPVLALLLPAASYQEILTGAPSGRLVSAVYLDQPVSRIAAALIEALPGVRRFGVVLGDESRGVGERLGQALKRQGATLVSRHVAAATELLPELDAVLEDCAALVVLPDSRISNRYTVPTLLLQTYRQRIPVLGFSQAWLTAGSALALFSTEAQMAAAAVASAREWISNGVLPPPRHAPDFVLGVNRYVARSLGLALPEEGQLVERVRQREVRP